MVHSSGLVVYYIILTAEQSMYLCLSTLSAFVKDFSLRITLCVPSRVRFTQPCARAQGCQRSSYNAPQVDKRSP
jgi:hypothetical protein